ncbi:short chain dehydrogenase [Photobacterium profundum]|uniref:Short chain dehydrogenase n=1 Tax=Photobacterium profundum 3TCK TaxID=314280 RepID=Q1YZ70_9GAMM|nr:short chain dehydrogenase [Photobacterium profundum]EAS41587.1 short chain dehydrogenase [Photobacterium profundum 3TCK]PSV64041.1 short chain dehydrogenase [Photobacterium profundum]
MKILVIGATGTIGSALVASLKEQSNASDIQVISVGRGNKPDSTVQLDFTADLEDMTSIETVLKRLGSVDAIVNFAGGAALGKVFGSEAMSFEDYNVGFQSKLMGQVNLAKLAESYLTPGGSITLTSGQTSSIPVLGMTAAAMVNAAIDTFVQGAALELGDGKRINSVSPGMLQQTMQQIPGLDTTGGVDIKEVVAAYQTVIMDRQINGKKLVVSTEDDAIALKAFGVILASMPKQN